MRNDPFFRGTTAGLAFSPEKIFEKVPQSREAVLRVDVMFDHIKREIIRSAECPDGDQQQDSRTKGWGFDQHAGAGEKAEQDKQPGLEIHEPGVFEVHGGLFRQGLPKQDHPVACCICEKRFIRAQSFAGQFKPICQCCLPDERFDYPQVVQIFLAPAE